MTLDEFKRIAKLMDDAPKADRLPSLDELQRMCGGVLLGVDMANVEGDYSCVKIDGEWHKL